MFNEFFSEMKKILTKDTKKTKPLPFPVPQPGFMAVRLEEIPKSFCTLCNQCLVIDNKTAIIFTSEIPCIKTGLVKIIGEAIVEPK